MFNTANICAMHYTIGSGSLDIMACKEILVHGKWNFPSQKVFKLLDIMWYVFIGMCFFSVAILFLQTYFWFWNLFCFFFSFKLTNYIQVFLITLLYYLSKYSIITLFILKYIKLTCIKQMEKHFLVQRHVFNCWL